MQNISLMGVASYMPPNIVENDFFKHDATNVDRMFKGVVRRRHVSMDETADSMIEKAANKLIQQLNLNPQKDIDLILTNVSLPDQVFTGCGAIVAKHLGAQPKMVIDLHNTGCISFIYMMRVASALMRDGQGNNALICNVQNTGGQIFAQSEIRKKPQAAIPGDGCGVGYLAKSDESPILSIVTHMYSENAADMFGSRDDGKKYWEQSEHQIYVDFNKEKIITIIWRGNMIVPKVIKEACQVANLPLNKIDMLITNQPNLMFIKHWHEAIGLPAEKHFHTFQEYANLFGAGPPVNLDEAIRTGALKANDYLVLAGFSHAGDYAAAAVIHWKEQS